MTKFTAVLASILAMVSGCVAPEYVETNAGFGPGQDEEGNKQMVLVPVGPASGGPFTTVLCPDDGTTATAEDIRRVASVGLRNDELQGVDISALQSGKVDRSGDTMTGTLTITPSGPDAAIVATAGVGLGDAAASFTGDGSFPGVRAVGGANGTGLLALAGGGNGKGIEATGSGSGVGIEATGGASGAGIRALPGTAQTNTAPKLAGEFVGYASFTGTNPNSNVDPGANNAIHGANIIKSWVTFDNAYTILDGYNVASITHIVGSIYRMTFVRPMANANYGIKIHVHGAPGYSGAQANGTKTTTHFDFVLFATDTLTLGFGSADDAYIEVTGKQ